MTAWIAIAIAIMGPLLTFAVHWGYSKRRWVEVDKHTKYHGEHFEAIRQLEHQTAITTQHLEDHEHFAIERIERIERMFAETRADIKETRADIKEILKSLHP